jgi:diguanylate cyclase (GGDEF)-like protein
MLLYFVLSALLPILFLAVLYFEEIGGLLDRQAHANLEIATKSYRTSLYERLLLVDELLRSAVGELGNAGIPGAVMNRRKPLENLGLMSPVGRAFRSLTLELPSGKVVSVIGDGIAIYPLSTDKLTHLGRGEPLLLSRTVSGRARVLVSRALDPRAPEQGVVTAELQPEYLWGDPGDFPYGTIFCVFNYRYEPLFCPAPQQPGLIRDMIVSSESLSKGRISWKSGQDGYLAGFSELFFQPKFHEARWLVTASQSEAIALNAITTFNKAFWGSLVLSVFVALLLSVTQIRRILVPLTRLTEGARNFGAQNLSARVEVSSSDEFGELAESFNSMSSQVSRQFEAQAALSKIDQAILSEPDLDQIIQHVLVYLRNTFSADYSSIIIFNQGSPGKSVVYAADGSGVRPQAECAAFADGIRDILRAAPDGLWIADETAIQEVQAGVGDAGAPHVFALPIIWKNQLTGVMSFGYRERPLLAPTDIKHIRDFADRVGVALSALARESLLLQQARIDSLTMLPNRFFFMDRLTQEIAQAQREGEKLAVLFVDLDRFKFINDSLGHAAGDELLQQAGARLRQCLRAGDTVARLGGDEFVILLGRLASPKEAVPVAEHAIEVLSKPFLIANIGNYVSASVGVAMYPADGTSAEVLVRSADMAMYRAKSGARGTYMFFEEKMNEEVVRRGVLERELRVAILERQFVVHYQPQINSISGHVQCVEALVRWAHPARGMVSPLSFIQIAEDTGLIQQIGGIVLAQACARFRAWRDEGIHLDHVAVNISPRQFLRTNLVEQIEAELDRNGLSGNCLELEITEGVLLEKSDLVLETFARLKALGIKIAIDDFGTGYSSMAYLNQLPFDTLKIDKQFVEEIDDEGRNGVIAETIVAMSKALNKSVVAEGVETPGQAALLRKLGCDLLQGYFYSRPLPGEALAAFIRATNACPPAQPLDAAGIAGG